MDNVMNANNILFRCSSLGYIMTEGRGKSNFEKWLDATAAYDKAKSDYDLMVNKETKTAIKKKESIQKLARLVAELVLIKDEKTLSDTCQTHLVDVYVSNRYNRFTEIHAKQLDKGNSVEEGSIDIVSVITRQVFKKNEDHLSNDFIKGTPDLFTGKDVYHADTIRDTKSSWDAYSFFRARHKDLVDMYYWQGTGYMWLSGATKCSIDYCLNNTPWHILEGELRKESYKHAEGNTPAWIEIQIIANHVYDKKNFDEYLKFRDLRAEDANAAAVIAGFVEIPLEERHFNIEFDRNDDDIERLKARIMECRIFLNKYLFKSFKQAA